MREQLYVLLTLQELDREIVREKKKQKRLPARILEIDDIISNIEKKYQKEKDSLKELQSKIKRREIDAKAINTKIEKHQDELYSGKTSEIKELKQLQKVIELLKNDRDRIEEDLLVLMDEEDQLKVNLSEIEKELFQVKNQLQQIQKEVNQQGDVIKECIERKNKERVKIVNEVNNRELMERYRMLWSEKDGKVVVEIDGPTCSGCNLSLPSDILYRLQRDDLLITCPNCNRILVWKKTL